MWRGSLQEKSERSDWFFLVQDFAIQFFVLERRQIQTKHGPSATY